MGRKIVYINGTTKDVENKTGILYNDTVEQLKGCGAAWQRVCFGYKMSRVQILSSLPITAPLSSNEESTEIHSNWAESFIFLKLYSICRQNENGLGLQKESFSLQSYLILIRKRSQFSSVERGSPKPDVVGSNPTERDFFFVDRIRMKQIHSLAQQSEFDLLWIKERRRSIKKRNVN